MRDVALRITHRFSNLALFRRWPCQWPSPLTRESQRVPYEPWLQASPLFLLRGVKSKATTKLKDLPQGVLEGKEVLPSDEDEGPSYPAVVQQAWNNMQRFEDCVVLTRVGNFYEVNTCLGLPYEF